MPRRFESGWRIAVIAFSVILALFAPQIHLGQGMIGRGATAMPKPKPSGRVFPVEFTDVAVPAGLTAPQICGSDKKKYIVESIGTGVAFLDYDNDGWQDVFLVNGSRFDRAAGA